MLDLLQQDIRHPHIAHVLDKTLYHDLQVGLGERAQLRGGRQPVLIGRQRLIQPGRLLDRFRFAVRSQWSTAVSRS